MTITGVPKERDLKVCLVFPKSLPQIGLPIAYLCCEIARLRLTKCLTIANHASIDKAITFHSSRPTFATIILTTEADSRTTCKMLGHTSVHTTEIYADVVMEKK